MSGNESSRYWIILQRKRTDARVDMPVQLFFDTEGHMRELARLYKEQGFVVIMRPDPIRTPVYYQNSHL